MRRSPAPSLAVLALAVLPAAATAQSAGCQAPEHREFDFWIGTWDVTGPAGQVAGRNTIQPLMGGCVLHESYDGQRGYHGESFNMYDRGRGVWHQTWVDNGGTLLRLDGSFADGRMVLEGETTGPDGTVTLNRITWSLVDGDPDRVRQYWEGSTDEGRTWSVVFDGLYTRADPAGG